MADKTHLFEPAAVGITFTADAAITAGQIVAVTADRQVSPAGAASKAVIGVAATDAADGDKVLVLVGGVQEVVASATIAAGGLVIAAAAGEVAPIGSGTFDQLIGTALTGGDDGDTIQVRFRV